MDKEHKIDDGLVKKLFENGVNIFYLYSIPLNIY